MAQNIDIRKDFTVYLKYIGIYCSSVGFIAIVSTYLIQRGGYYEDVELLVETVRDVAIGIFTMGIIVYSIESLKINVDRAIDDESFKSIIRSNLKDDILKIDSLDETKIKYKVVNTCAKGSRVVGDVPLSHYLDLKLICAYPRIGAELSHFIANEIKKRITGFNSNQYGLLCPISENNYLATRIAAILEIPVIFVKIEPPDTCNECEDCCSLGAEFMPECEKMNAELLFDGVPVSGKQYILFDDISLTGDKQCFSAAITKKWRKDIKIPYAIILILRTDADGDKVEKKLMQHVGSVESIWKLKDADIAIIIDSGNP